MASSDQVGVYRIAETTWGTTPATGNLIETRRSGGSFSTGDSYTQSPEVRKDRMIPDQVQTDRAPTGTIEIAMSLGGTYDDMFEGALAATASAGASTTAALTVVASTGTVTMTGAFTAAVVGQWFRISGSVGNDGPYRIAKRTSNDEVVVEDNSGLTDATSEAGVTIDVSEMIRNGSTPKSHTYFEQYSDLTAPELWMVYRGERISSMDLNVQAQQILSGSFSLMGGTPAGAPDPVVEKVNADPTGPYTVVPATETDVLNAITDVELLMEGGVTLSACVNQFQTTIDNQLRGLACIGHLGPAEINYGTLAVSGNLNAYLGPQALALIDKHLAAQASSLAVAMLDGNGNYAIVTVPRLRYSTGTPEAGGQNSDVPLNLAYAAMRDPATDCMVQIDLFNAL